MGTSSASLNNALSILAPQTSTTGTSSFSSDLQASVTRALQIAALPAQLVQQDQATLNSKNNELSTLSSLFDSLQTALQNISSGAGSSAIQTSVGDSSILTASINGTPLPGAYTVDVLDPGSTSSAESSGSNVTDPATQNISSASSFTLTAGGSNYTITPAANSLNALAAAINASGAPAQAVVVNLGSPSSPNYQLMVQSTALGNVVLQLNDGANNLLSTLTTGTNGSYTVNGQPPSGISTDSSTVTIAPGLNVTLKAAGTTTVTISSNLDSVSNQLSAFVNAYNSAFSELEKNFGKNGGALTGDSTVFNLQSMMRQVVSYLGTSGSITSLSQLGVEFTQQGTLSFNSSAISSLSQTQINDALTFIGDPNGGGFLQYANNILNNITDPSTGLIASESQTLQTAIQNDQNKINNDELQLTTLQTNLQNQMAQANALIATLQNQSSFLLGLFQAGTSTNPNAPTVG